jgi:hypothetical protein
VEVNEYVEHIVELASEIESEDPIDWGMLAVDEEQAYRLIASGLVEQYLPKYNDPNFRDIMMATVVKLVVENFTLNLKLREQL